MFKTDNILIVVFVKVQCLENFSFQNDDKFETKLIQKDTNMAALLTNRMRNLFRRGRNRSYKIASSTSRLVFPGRRFNVCNQLRDVCHWYQLSTLNIDTL